MYHTVSWRIAIEMNEFEMTESLLLNVFFSLHQSTHNRIFFISVYVQSMKFILLVTWLIKFLSQNYKIKAINKDKKNE